MNPRLEKALGDVGKVLGRVGARAGAAMMQSALEDVGDLAQVVGRRAKAAAKRWAESLPKEDELDPPNEGTKP
jgi:hypothetical protein